MTGDLTQGQGAPAEEGPGGPPLPAIRGTLDRAMVLLSRVDDGRAMRSVAEERLANALRHVYHAIANHEQSAAFREGTRFALEEARAALAALMEQAEPDERALEVTALVARTLGDLQRVRWVALEHDLPRHGRPVPYVRASLNEPQLLTLSRHVLRPAVPIPQARLQTIDESPPEVLPAPVASIEALKELAAAHWERLMAFQGAGLAGDEEEEGEPDDRPAVDPLPLLTREREVVERFGLPLRGDELLAARATECMEDLAMFGRMRRCTPPEPWASGEDTERRMLTRVDAIAACGTEAFPALIRMLDDAPLPDPELTFGNVFFFGSLAGGDSFDQVERLLELSALDDAEVATMVTDALVLAPHPRIVEHMGSWLSDADADRRAIAVDVLRRRKALTLEQFEQVGADPDERVLAGLARALPNFEQPPPGALSWFLQHESESVARAALEASMRLARRAGYERACSLMDERGGAWAEAAMFVAIAGDDEARPLLEEDLATSGSTTTLRALGWYGDATYAPFLLGRLRHGDEGQVAAALEALERITGASIVDASIAPEYTTDDAPFTRGARAYEPPGILSNDADAWEAWWEAWGEAAEPKKRYRWGHLFTLGDLAHELAHPGFLQGDRPWASMQLSYGARVPPALDWTDLVLRQKRAVAGIAGRYGGRRGE